MQKQCADNFYTTFSSFPQMLDYHELQTKSSKWLQMQVKELDVEPLDKASPFFGNLSAFAVGTTNDAVEDTANNLGLALRIDGELYPVRTTAYKSLLDRAKIGGSALPKLQREQLAGTLNACLKLHSSNALALVRDEKVTAVHSGDNADYSVLPIDKLLAVLKKKLDDRFPDNSFEQGYSDHSITSATWRFPKQKDDIMGTYASLLKSTGKSKIADKLIPGVRFVTSDAGVASAKVSALLFGFATPIHIGGCISVDHRHGAKVEDFEAELDGLFAQFADNIKKLEKLLDITLSYPVNAMTRICKKLCMPKKEAIEAIAMFEAACGSAPATAHDVFIALQEIMFILKANNTPESKIITLEENMARVLSLNWKDYDLAKGVNY